jgi:alpha-tubulin suppressor-like RCC1 family protein
MLSLLLVSCNVLQWVDQLGDDRCLAWGNNLHGQLGLNEIGSYEEPPREIKTLRGFGVSTVACSDNFSGMLI